VTERSGSDRADKAVEEATSVFTPGSERNKGVQPTQSATQHGTLETTQPDRPSVPVGSSAPPWQRVPASGGSGGSAHDPGSEATAVADQNTVAESRPSYPAPVHGASNVSGNGSGSSSGPPNPFLTRMAASGAAASSGPTTAAMPPAVQPGHSVPPGGTGAIPVGGQAGPVAGHHAQPGVGSAHAVPSSGHGAHAVPGTGHRPPPSARPPAPPRGRPVRAPRKASLQIRRVDPWSVLKLSLVLSVAMFLMWLVAVGVLYGVLDGMGVWDKLNGAYSDLASVNDATGGGEPLISAGRVFGVSAVVGVVNIVLFTAFATVAAFVYNVSADLAGGIEVTLSERD
jgi:hypothetical protein